MYTIVYFDTEPYINLVVESLLLNLYGEKTKNISLNRCYGAEVIFIHLFI